jgi:hypothetical protein
MLPGVAGARPARTVAAPGGGAGGPAGAGGRAIRLSGAAHDPFTHGIVPRRATMGG